VVSNVWLGLVFGGMVPGLHAAAMTAAAVCLYLCGTFLNDWADQAWDAERRPERALPRGLFAPVSYLAVSVGLAIAAIGITLGTAPRALAPAVLILANIGLYTWLHKKSAWAVVPMGLCRALLPVMGFSAGATPSLMPAVLVAGLGLFCHVAGISWLARDEAMPQSFPRWHRFPRLHPAIWCFAACAVIMTCGALWILRLPPAACLIAVLPYALYTAHALLPRYHIAARVSALLAGIPLVDWILLQPMYLVGASAVSGTAAVGICLWLPPMAFIAGRLLQRIAPAT
jgi:4-hydroxybenzoate polyprenyltransferase